MHMHITEAGKNNSIIGALRKDSRAEKLAVNRGQIVRHIDSLKKNSLDVAHIRAPFSSIALLGTTEASYQVLQKKPHPRRG